LRRNSSTKLHDDMRCHSQLAALHVRSGANGSQEEDTHEALQISDREQVELEESAGQSRAREEVERFSEEASRARGEEAGRKEARGTCAESRCAESRCAESRCAQASQGQARKDQERADDQGRAISDSRTQAKRSAARCRGGSECSGARSHAVGAARFVGPPDAELITREASSDRLVVLRVSEFGERSTPRSAGTRVPLQPRARARRVVDARRVSR
jgi:hypothetical protein